MPTAHKSHKGRINIEKLKQKLVKLLVSYSINLQKGENVLIQFKSQDALQLATDISEEVLRQGGVPYVQGIYDEGGSLSYVDTEKDIFNSNLVLIDSRLLQILAEMINLYSS